MQFMAEVRPTLKRLPGIDLDDYTATIVKRFSNSKFAIRWHASALTAVRKDCKIHRALSLDLLAANRSPRVLPFVIASWLHYLRGHDENGRGLSISDSSLGSLKPFLDAGGSDAGLALSVRPLFGEFAFSHPHLVTQGSERIGPLRSHGRSRGHHANA
jgi:mannitol-1-phosphate/altronate dehydrogenase